MSEQRPPAPRSEHDILAELEAEVARELEEARPPAGGPAYQIAGAVTALVIGLGAAALSWSYGLGSLVSPGPGLWPFVISVGIAVLGAVLLVVGRDLQDSERFSRASLLPAVGALTFIGMAALMPLVGFEWPGLVLCIIWLRFLGGESWRSTIVISVLTVVAFYFLFLYGLNIPLPHLY